MRPVLSLLVCLLLSGGAGAYLPPDLSLRRTELVQLLPYGQVVALQQWIRQLPTDLTPSRFCQQLRQQFPQQESVAWVFYASWSYLDHLEDTLQAYDQRSRDLETGIQWLEEYRGQVESVATGGEAVLVEPALAIPQLEKTEKGLRVFRLLPWPQPTMQAAALLQASQADRETAQAQREKVALVKQAFEPFQQSWMEWLMDFAEASHKFSQSQYLAPFGDPLPPAP